MQKRRGVLWGALSVLLAISLISAAAAELPTVGPSISITTTERTWTNPNNTEQKTTAAAEETEEPTVPAAETTLEEVTTEPEGGTEEADTTADTEETASEEESTSEPETTTEPETTAPDCRDFLTVDELIELKTGINQPVKYMDVTANTESNAYELDVRTGLLLAKRLNKLAEASQFDKIVFRGSSFVNVRKEPTTSADKVGKMYYNAVATIKESVYAEDGLWYHIESGSVDGYVKSSLFVSGSDAMDLLNEIKQNWVEMKNDTQRLYEIASTNGATLTTLSSGVRYRAVGTDGNYTKIYVGATPQGSGAYGYVPTANLEHSSGNLTAISLSEETMAQEKAKSVVEAQASIDASRQASRVAASINASIQQSKAAESSRYAASQSQIVESIKDKNWAKYAQYIPAGTSNLRRSIVLEALKYVDVLEYQWGGESLIYGADCSGFCKAIYGKFGIYVEHYTVVIAKSGTAVSSIDKAKPADLICYRITSNSGHVGIYIGNGYVVHSPQTGQKVKVDKWNFISVTTIRNVIGDR